jgi:hypothetical protein
MHTITLVIRSDPNTKHLKLGSDAQFCTEEGRAYLLSPDCIETKETARWVQLSQLRSRTGA